MIRFVVAGITAAFVSASAWAMPAAAPVESQGNLILAQHKKDLPKRGPGHAKPGPKHKFKPGQKFKPGHKYKSAPKGWRRHGKRPTDWQRRGCIIVGPVWFCP